MKKPIILIACGLILGLVLAAVALWVFSLASSRADNPISYRGDTLKITLDENPTTGFVWSFAIEGDSVQALDDEYFSDLNPRGYDGVGGRHVFRFKGISGGIATIQFFLSREWEDNPPFQELTIEVEIGDNGRILSAQMVE